MKVTVYTSHIDIHNLCLSKMYEGCPFEKEVRKPEDYEPSDIAVIFGIRKDAVPASWQRGEIFRRQWEAGKTTVVLDSGYVKRGDHENAYHMVGVNGLNNRADFRNEGSPPDRWERLGVDLQPWKDGEHILICGQVPWDASCQHVPNQKWCQDAVYELQRFTKRPIRYRPHPKALEHCPPIRGAEYSLRPTLREDLKDCWAVVTFNSNSSVDAVIQGVPVFTFDEGAMAKEVSLSDFSRIETPWMPDRAQWAADLAYTQWTPDEMGEGLPWAHLFGSS